MHKLESKKLASKYDAATSECFSFVLAIKISQKTDHHSKRKPPGASIASHLGMHNRININLKYIKNSTFWVCRYSPTGSEDTFPSD